MITTARAGPRRRRGAPLQAEPPPAFVRWHAILYYIILCYVVLYYVMLCYIILYHFILCYAMLYYILILHYIMLYYITPPVFVCCRAAVSGCYCRFLCFHVLFMHSLLTHISFILLFETSYFNLFLFLCYFLLRCAASSRAAACFRLLSCYLSFLSVFFFCYM